MARGDVGPPYGAPFGGARGLGFGGHGLRPQSPPAEVTAPRLIVLGWDSASFDVIDQLVDRQRLPCLASLMAGGYRAPLRSTWPPMTDCAWTSAFTGVNPGAHGIFGSWYRAPGAYACRYFSSRDRVAQALWEMGDGCRFLVWNVPMSFPPSPLSGAMVSGYGAPPGARFCEPAEIQDELSARWDLADLLDRAPHGSLDAFLDDLLRGLRAQAEALPWAIRHTSPDCAVAVWPHVDRAQHFFWRFRHTSHRLAGAVERVYQAMDSATAAVVDAFPGSNVVVVSDHGAGPLYGDVNLGAWLARSGHALHGRKRRRALLELAWAMPPVLRRAGRRLAPRLARGTFGATLAGQLGPFDWTRTQAFLGFHGDLWLNLAGREPQGIVSPAASTALLRELRGELLELRDPHRDRPVVAAAHDRDEIYRGRAVGLAPDLMLDSWSAGYRVAPGRGPSEEVVAPPSALAGVAEAWSSDHRPTGIFVAAGPSIAAGSGPGLSLYDVCPTALALLSRAVPAELDGRVAEDAIDSGFLARHPVGTRGPAGARATAGGYSEAEASSVASHLRDLGYIE